MGISRRSLQSDKFHHVEVTLQPFEHRHTLGVVKLDGEELSNVRGVKIEAGHDQITEVTITLIASVSAMVNGAKVTEIKVAKVTIQGLEVQVDD
jgi:hypothetical protein